MRRERTHRGRAGLLAAIAVAASLMPFSPNPAHAAEGTVAITSTAIDKTATWAGDAVTVSFSYACNGAGGDVCSGVTAAIPGVFGTDLFGAPFGPLTATTATTTPDIYTWHQDWMTGTVNFLFVDPLPAGSAGNVTVTFQTRSTSVPDGTSHTFSPQITSTGGSATGTPRSVQLVAESSWRAYHGFHFGWSYPDQPYYMGANWCANNRSGPSTGPLYEPGSYLELIIKHPDVVVVDPGGGPGVTTTVTSTFADVQIRWEPTSFFEGCKSHLYVLEFPSSVFAPGDTIEFELQAFSASGIAEAQLNTDGVQRTWVMITDPPPPTIWGYKRASGMFTPGSDVEWTLNVVVEGGLPADEVTIVEELPAGQDLVRLTSGSANQPGTVTVEYSTSGAAGPWSAVPGSPFDRMAPEQIEATDLPSGITHLRWNFGTIAPYSIPGARVVTRIPDDAEVGATVTNCEQVFASFRGELIWGGQPGDPVDYCWSITVLEPTPLPFLQILPPWSVAAGTTATVGVVGLNNGNGPFFAPRYSVVLPAGFSYVPGSARSVGGMYGASGVSEPLIGEHPDFPGQAWLVFDLPSDVIPPRVDFTGRREFEFDVLIPPFDYTEPQIVRAWLGAVDPDAPTPVAQCDAFQTTADTSDWDGDGTSDDVVCRATGTTSTPRLVAANADHDGSDDATSWSSVLDVAPGASATLRATLRNTSTTTLGTTEVIWLLPAAGDEEPRSNTGRGSQFHATLTGPVAVDVMATVEYATQVDPCRGGVGGPDGAGVDCVPGDWAPWGVHAPGSVRAVRLQLPRGIPIGQAIQVSAPVALPDLASLVSTFGAEGTVSAWSSYAFRSSVVDTGDVLDGESQPVLIRLSWQSSTNTTNTTNTTSSTPVTSSVTPTTVPAGPSDPTSTTDPDVPLDPSDPTPSTPADGTIPVTGLDRLPATGGAGPVGLAMVCLGLGLAVVTLSRRRATSTEG